MFSSKPRWCRYSTILILSEYVDIVVWMCAQSILRLVFLRVLYVRNCTSTQKHARSQICCGAKRFLWYKFVVQNVIYHENAQLAMYLPSWPGVRLYLTAFNETRQCPCGLDRVSDMCLSLAFIVLPPYQNKWLTSRRKYMIVCINRCQGWWYDHSFCKSCYNSRIINVQKHEIH